MACEDCDRLGVADSWHQPTGADDYRQGTSLEERAADILQECLAVLISKHRDYSPLNISGSPFGVLEGLLTRLWDKQARAVSLVSSDREPNHESLIDTAMDSINYWLIFILCYEGYWPGVKPGGKR